MIGHDRNSAMHRAIRVFAVLGSLALLAACGADPNALPARDLDPPSQYTLGSGDHLHIIVYGQDTLTGDYTVEGSGNLAFPLIGTVKARGLTTHELAEALASRLSPNYLKNPSISVSVATYRPFYIIGEVKNPGSYPYVDGMTVMNAIALAGGFTYRAKESAFYITRDEPTGADAGAHKYVAYQQTPVAPGDIVTVRERYF